MRIGLRKKVLLISVAFNLVFTALLVLALSMVTYSRFYRSFLHNKMVLADAMAGAIDGDIHQGFKSVDAQEKKSYQDYFRYMTMIKKNDPDITYLYTLNYDKEDDVLLYGIDAGVVERNTFWIESDYFALALSIGEGGGIEIEYNQATYTDAFKMKVKDKEVEVRVKDDGGHNALYLDSQKILTFLAERPLLVQLGQNIFTRKNRFREEMHNGTLDIDGLAVEVLYTLSLEGEALSLPGTPLMDDPNNLEFLKRIIKENQRHLLDTPKKDLYGTRISAYSVLRNALDEPVGLLAIEMYDNEIKTFKTRLVQISALAFAVIFLATFIISYISSDYLIKPIKNLLEAVTAVTSGKLDTHVDIDRKDEMGELAHGFNVMTEAIKLHTDHLEELVRLRTQELQREQENSERLLLNVLPEPIAARLKQGEEVIVDRFDNVTVLFADLVGFTKLSSQYPPVKIVNMLNILFLKFDELTEKYHLEKIKTIGDAYMVAGGLPEKDENNAENVVRMALEMTEKIKEISNLGDGTLSIRIGINTGPVVAGVIGTKKFIYDLWGDTVNTASRMESHGIPGSIHVSEPVYERLKDRFVFESRGEIEVKGKGRMSTYFLVGPREEVG